MKVSICLITYNHEDFIAQAIESVLMQQTSFAYEVVIGEDCSTDRTRAIVLDYQHRFPEKIRVLPSPHNLGLPRNFARTFQACRAPYIAMMDGDDYWASPDKLQKQVEWLDAHPDCALCCHAFRVHHDHEPQPVDAIHGSDREIVTFADLPIWPPIATSSVLLRAAHVGGLPTWFADLPAEDFTTYLLAALRGHIRYLPEAMSVYRIHATGMWSSKPMIERARHNARVLEMFRAHLELDEAQTRIVQVALSKQRLQAAIALYASGERAEARAELGRAVADHQALLESADLLLSAIMYVRHACSQTDNEAFLKALFADLLPQTPLLASVHRRLQAQLHMREVFEGIQQHDPQRVDAHLWKGIRHDPSWLLNRGVLSTLIRSLYRQSKLKLRATV